MSVSPVPDPRQPLAPYLIVKEAVRAIEFYVRAIGAVERFRFATRTEIVSPAEMQRRMEAAYA